MEVRPISFTTIALSSYHVGESSKINITNDREAIDKGIFKNTAFNDILEKYRSVLFNSLITAFGLDQLFFADKDGGNVQTVHNAKKNFYANKTFKNRMERKYERDDYATANYMNIRRKNDFKKINNIYDGYTGKKLSKDGTTHLEHVASAKENHDRLDMRLFSNKDEMSKVINSKENTTYIDSGMNQSKGAKPLRIWANETSKRENDKTNSEYYGVDLDKAHEADRVARKKIDKYVARRKLQHYSGSMALDGAKHGSAMAIRQALGVIFTEVAITVMDEIPGIIKCLQSNFSIEIFFKKIGEVVVIAFKRIEAKMKDIIDAAKSGFGAGVFSSILTSVVNMFATTGKNIIRLIRQSLVSITEAFRILFFDKENSTVGERVVAASKVIMTGASVVLGVVMEQWLSSSLQASGIVTIPVIGSILADIIPIFSGTLLTGLLSVTILYFMDNDEKMKKLMDFINKISEDCFDRSLNTIKEANQLLDNYISELCNIDLDKLRKQVMDIHKVNYAIEGGNVEVLYKYCNDYGIKLQFSNTQQFKRLMLSEELLEI